MTVLIAGGGTGGHVFPMVAVGDAVRAVDSRARVVYVGTSRGIEARVVPERGDELELLHVLPLRGRGVMGFLAGAARAAASIPEARRLVSRLAPDVVLGVGGYAAGPVSLAARTLGVPVALLEPNSVLGLSNKLLSPVVERAYTAFPEAERYLRPSVVVRAGVPLRSAFAPSPYRPDPERFAVLVIGGSQGATALNERVPRAIAEVARAVPSLRVTHQAGRDRDAAVCTLYADLGAAACARVVPFIDDVAGALAEADLVIARAGASTLSEICAVGRPALLVPYPFAADRHQHENARSLEQAGAAFLLGQEEATPERLAATIRRIAADAGLRERMARAAAGRGLPDAAARVADDLLRIARAHAARGRSPAKEARV